MWRMGPHSWAMAVRVEWFDPAAKRVLYQQMMVRKGSFHNVSQYVCMYIYIYVPTMYINQFSFWVYSHNFSSQPVS